MDTPTPKVEIILGLIIVGLIVFFAYKFYLGPILPSVLQKEGFRSTMNRVSSAEGFFGGAANEVGVPDCLRTSSEAAKIAGIFQSAGMNNDRVSGAKGGIISNTLVTDDNYRELIELLGKLACFKKDLMSPSNIVDATRRQPFSTSHDMESVGETTARCYTKTISPRDLELSFDKWYSRGKVLMNRLSSICKSKSAEQEEAVKLFEVLVRDVKDIARGACLQGVPVIGDKPGPRDAHPYEDPSLQEFGEYKGYY
jgi:hypothetical protein